MKCTKFMDSITYIYHHLKNYKKASPHSRSRTFCNSPYNAETAEIELEIKKKKIANTPHVINN